MNFKDMICDVNGQISQAKVWTNVAFTIGSFVLIRLALVDSSHIVDIFLWYLMIVSGSELGKKFMTMKLTNKESEK